MHPFTLTGHPLLRASNLLPGPWGVIVTIANFAIMLIRLFSRILDFFLTLWARSPPANQVIIEPGGIMAGLWLLDAASIVGVH